jgi:D-alanine transaminase
MKQDGVMHGWPGRTPPGRVAYVNGRYLPHGKAGVHIEDRGLQFADAVYEVFGVIDGAIYDEDEHIDRLERSLRELQMSMPTSRSALKLVVRELARRNRVANGLIYLQITRGAYRRDHAIPAGRAIRPTIILTARNIDTAQIEARRHAGIRVVTGPDERWDRCDIKSTALLANVLAKTAARQAGAYEAWLLDEEGFVTEGSSTTAWIVDRDGRLVTHDLSHSILPGVTRKVILEVAVEAQMPVVERRFTPAEAVNAREAFISAATIGALPVISIDGRGIGDGKPGPLTLRIQDLYRRRAATKAQDPEAP